MIYDFDYEIELINYGKECKYYKYYMNSSNKYNNIILWYKTNIADVNKNSCILILHFGLYFSHIYNYNLQNYIKYDDDDNILLPFYFRYFSTTWSCFCINKIEKLYIQQLDYILEETPYYMLENFYLERKTIKHFVKYIINLNEITSFYYYINDNTNIEYKFEINNINLEHFSINKIFPMIVETIPIKIIKIIKI